MAVSKKGKRKLVYKGRDYYWYMKFTDDWTAAYPGPQLHIISDDKKFIVSYQPQQQNGHPFMIIKKDNIVGLNDKSKGWRRVKVPHWQDDEITPGFVSNLLDWCYDEKKKMQQVNYLGELI